MPDLRCLETIRSPHELNRLLILIREFKETKGYAAKKRLKITMKEQAFHAGPVSFNDVLDLALYFRLVHDHGDSISITPTGDLFLNGNPNNDYLLTEEQKYLLINSILFGRHQLSKQFELILGDFSYNPNSNRYEAAIFATSGRLSALGMRLFCSTIGFLNEADNGIHFFDPIFNTEIARRIRIFRNTTLNGQELSEEDLARSKHAEELIYTDERRRLDSTEFPELSRRVQWVSEYNSAAGYDILSFEGAGSKPEMSDRFIEVKSSSEEKMHFFFTRNERKKAQEYREQYLIIFIGNHEIGKQLKDCRVRVLRNPEEHIYDRNRFILDAPKLHVTEKESKDLEISED